MDSWTPTGVLAATVTICVGYLVWSKRRPSAMPPGPPHIPYIGSILSMTDEVLHKLFVKWKHTYGPVFTFSMGNLHTVVLADYATIKEGLVTLGTQLAGRPSVHGPFSEKLKRYSPIYPQMGIMDTTFSEEWKKQRNTALQILRGLGYGRHAMEDKISDEAQALCDVVRKLAELPTNPELLLNISVANVICSLLYGKRYEHDDADLQKLLETLGPMFKAFENEKFADCMPILRVRPAYHHNLAVYKETCNSLNEFNAQKVKERKKRLEEEGYDDPRDFIEYYLKELRDLDKSKLQEDWLQPIINDFFLAGAETTATTLQWSLLHMAMNPELQEKVQAEIDEVFGQEPHVFRLSDREKLPHVEATIMEIQRHSPIAPMTLIHHTMQEVNIGGYTIPAGTDVMCCLYAVLSDPEIWPEPEKLKPERFLDENGKVRRAEEWIPFSMGRRVCLGEQLARQELFLFFTSLIHSFRISWPKDAPAPDMNGRTMSVWKPPIYQVTFAPRFK